MGSIMTSLLNSANAMRVYEGALEVTENNITNANTPGYAKQVANLEARPFDLATGESGGVALNGAQSSRDQFAEQAVRDQQTAVNFYQQKASDLSPLENYFSTSNTSGIGPDMSSLFSAFSQLSVNPNDTVSRQAVLNQATTVALDFNQAANGLLSQGSNIDQGTRGTIDNINQVAQTIAQLNQQNRVDPQGGINAGVDAQLNAALEQLSQLVNYTALQQPDGTVSVYVGGQTPLVVSDQVYAIQGDFTAPQTAVLSSTGADITSEMTGGQLSALLDDKNNILPSYVNSLNSLAQNFADQVNTTLDNGIDENGAAPVTDLFTYDATTGAAQTLSVNPLTPDQIAAALPGSPGGNENALNLAALANAKDANGYTFAQLYGNLGGQIGSDLSAAQNNQSTKQALLNQAQSMRQQISGVSLDEEAQYVLEYQRSYQAIAETVTILNSLTQTLMNMMSGT